MIKCYSEHFLLISKRDGLLKDLSTDRYPVKLYGWGYTGRPLAVVAGGTHFGFVVEGSAQISTYHAGFEQTFTLIKGMYFCIPGSVSVRGGSGIIISSLNYDGMFSIGGPIEEKGRLLYMNGCSDSLLIPPTMKGDPCFNHLHFPSGTQQARHTHPSMRIGVVTGGKGRCVIPGSIDGTGADIEIPLTPGHIFVIPANGQHSFFTDDSTLDVVAYHPDSDMGPTHDDHPMVNRTIIDGKSVIHLPELRTVSIS
jgi:hypothetical protein